jgi:RNA polymerase sigma-70 factor (ECF subfamily)
MEDEQLMKNIAKGDRKAFSVLVKKHLSNALFHARRILSYEGDDAVQEAFLKVWRNAKLWDEDKGAFTTWFYRILNNVCYTFLKKKKKYEILSLIKDFQNDEIIENFALENKGTIESLNVAMLKLPKRQREVILLTYYKEYSNKETSEIMSKSVKAIEVLLVRARKKLRNEMIGDDYAK